MILAEIHHFKRSLLSLKENFSIFCLEDYIKICLVLESSGSF